MIEQKNGIAIITTCPEDWGGSEELWARTIPYLQAEGYGIVVYKHRLNKEHTEFAKLSRMGVILKELTLPLVLSIYKKIHKRFKKTSGPNYNETRLSYLLNKNETKLVIISQADNFDGLYLAKICLRKNIPYVMIAQKAIDHLWPPLKERMDMRNIYRHAVKAYFVSRHNKRLTEEQFGTKFTNAEVISNPVTIPREIIPMPETGNGYRLACIGRYFLLDKGQDILIRIMAMEKWKGRPLTISFIGTGDDKESLMEMAALLKVNNVEFLDRVDDIPGLWKNYHGLVLSSRNEGTPLVLLEAMACGRVGIVSTAGGNPDLITDGFNGFIGLANANDFDEVMERAWTVREKWPEIGKNAFNFIEHKIAYRPEEVFAASIKSILNAHTVRVS